MSVDEEDLKEGLIKAAAAKRPTEAQPHAHVPQRQGTIILPTAGAYSLLSAKLLFHTCYSGNTCSTLPLIAGAFNARTIDLLCFLLELASSCF